MKQQITIEQLGELKESQSERLLNWIIDKKYSFHGPALVTIGQMIEFLDEHKTFLNDNWWNCILIAWPEFDSASISKSYDGELCDALWDAIKEVL